MKKTIIIATTLGAIVLSAVFWLFISKASLFHEDVYCNRADGYYFELPKGFTADETFYPASVHFKSDDTTIELYTYSGSKEEIKRYIKITSEGICENKIDYKNVISTTDDENNSILKWERKKLKHVKNDKNYYLKVDIPHKNKVYTMLVKSTHSIGEHKDYVKRLSFHDDILPGETPKVKKARFALFNLKTYKFYRKYFLKNENLAWGIFQPDYMSGSLDEFEEKTEHEFEILQWYTAFYKEYNPKKVKNFLERAQSENKTVVLTLQPSWVHEEGNDFLHLLDGDYDDFLEDYITEIKNFKEPVIFRFANEMNGDWCEYCAYNLSLDSELYREAYRYVFNLFKKHKARNVIWVWNPNGKSFPDYSWNSEQMYYPGDEYVDVYGLTAYNTGTFYKDEEWKSFKDIYKPLYDNAMKQYDMPFMITEFASAREGGNKEEWTRNMLDDIREYENIKIAIWWNSSDYTDDGVVSREYSIDDSEEMIKIFKEYFNK